MTYDDLINSVSAIVNDETILKKGLVLMYYLDTETHRKMNEELFYRSNPITEKLVPNEEFEVELGGLIVKFVIK